MDAQSTSPKSLEISRGSSCPHKRDAIPVQIMTAMTATICFRERIIVSRCIYHPQKPSHGRANFAHRNFADRARGFPRCSASPAMIGSRLISE